MITEIFEPDRITLSLTMINERGKNGDKKTRLQASRSGGYLSEKIKDGVLESEVANRNRRYRLKK